MRRLSLRERAAIGAALSAAALGSGLLVGALLTPAPPAPYPRLAASLPAHDGPRGIPDMVAVRHGLQFPGAPGGTAAYRQMRRRV